MRIPYCRDFPEIPLIGISHFLRFPNLDIPYLFPDGEFHRKTRQENGLHGLENTRAFN